MAKTRILNLAKELKVDVKVLIQRLKDEMGLQVENYLNSLDEATVARVLKVMAQVEAQVEEKRLGDNIKRRRRVAPVAAAIPMAVSAEMPRSPLPPEPAPKVRKPKEAVVRVVSLPPKEVPSPEPLAPLAPAPAAEPAASVAPVAAETRGAVVAKEQPKVLAAKPAAPVDSGAALKRQKGKARKKEVPARIISLPTEPLPEPAAVAYPPAAAPAATRPAHAFRPGVKLVPAAKPAAEEEKKAKPKKKAKRSETPDSARAKPVKKREVRERADLYGLVESEARLPGRRRGMRKAIKKVSKADLTIPKAIKRRVKLGESITVGELAKRMGIKSGEIIKQLLQMGVMATINYPIDYDSAVLVASGFGVEVERAIMMEEDLLAVEPREAGEVKPRPPVVTIMGHVDHGKTSLLDAIRQSRIAAAEAGGITQHIGAYHVELPEGRGEVVFLDTPGHEAFTAMRARGAQITDLVVLVVAADDGVMEQTREAINHAKAAGVPLVVAVNKIDKSNANPERVKRELANEGVVSEEWGGDVLFAEVSAKMGTGIPDLLEKILLQAEVLDLKAPRKSGAQGRIIESRLDKGRGPVGTVLVQKGVLKAGDYFVCGPQFGKVRGLLNDQGQKVEKVTPGIPVEVQGFSGVPEAGDEFLVLEDERKAKQIAMMRQQKLREAALACISRTSLEKLYQRIQEGAAKELKIVLKADVAGSMEALSKALSELGTKEIKVSLIHQGMGEITESDVMLASASDAIVVGFNVRANPKALALAEQEQVDVRYYDIIYKLLEDIHAALEGLLEPVMEERVQGKVEVRQVFTISKVGSIAGCMVQDGKVERNSLSRVLRQGKVLIDAAKVTSLKRFKEDVKEVLAGYECGIGLDRFNEFQSGDIIEAYTQEKVKVQLEALPAREKKADE